MTQTAILLSSSYNPSLIARFMGPTWGPSGANRTQVGTMLAPWTLLSGFMCRTMMHMGYRDTRPCQKHAVHVNPTDDLAPQGAIALPGMLQNGFVWNIPSPAQDGLIINDIIQIKVSNASSISCENYFDGTLQVENKNGKTISDIP